MTKSPSQFLEQAAQPEMLIEQNERLNFILNKTPALIGYWDSQLINQFSNDAYSRWFVESPEQIKGMHLIQLLGDEIYTSLLSEIDGVLSGKEQRFERYLIDVNTGEKIHTLTRYLPDIVNDRVIGF
ncbi:MAG: PAS domain-containing protein, partial [Methylococcales bacterium]